MHLYSEEFGAVREYMEVQEILKSKRLKRKWFELTDSAQDLIEVNNPLSLSKAEKLLLKALKLASNSPFSRAFTFHNLGVLHYSYYDKLPGGMHDNLKKAIQYFERAIGTPERQRFPDKYASSLTQLGATYRRAADEYLWPERDVDCLSKAESLNLKAIELLNESDIPQSIKYGQLSVIYFNLASVLFDQGLIQEACECQAKSVELYLAFHSYNLPSFFNVIPPDQALGLSFARLNYFSSSESHKALCKRIFDVAHKFGLEPLSFMQINPTVDIAKPEEYVSYLIARAIKKPNEENVKALVTKQLELMNNRRFCRSDPESDYLATLVQRICSGLGRIYVKKNHPLDALRILENCSSLRFCENANKYWQVPSEHHSLALRDDLLQLGSTYHNLNELALMLEHVNEADIRPALQECYERAKNPPIFDKLSEATSFYNGRTYPLVLRAALNDKSPTDCLRQKANQCLDDFQKVENLIDQLDPNFAKRRDIDAAIEIGHFEKALRRYPNLTLIKIDIESGFDDALILVAQLVNEQLIVTGHTVDVPQGLVNHIGEFIRGDANGADFWSLDFIDWRKILPNDCRRIGLLTSFFASQIPWVATGLKGEELYTLVDEVNWLPSVLYLCNHVTHFSKRNGNKCINGGDTHFHNVANQYAPDSVRVVSKNEFIKAVSGSEVFSYYGHCTHEFPNRPSLKTSNFELNDLELVDQVVGMERIEFWACQSGSNIPLSVFSIPVNEAFGFDMRMIEWGAVSSVGALWALPDIVTAHIKSHYDQLVNDGISPSKALISAQRWWVSQGAKTELSKMRELGLTPYLNTLGCNEAIDRLLGPMKTANLRVEDELKHVENLFLHPSSWAGLRFCGLADQIDQTFCKDRLNLTVGEESILKNHLAKLQLKSGFMNYA